MDWGVVYERIVERARTRERPEGRLEVHHVLPRSMGGGDSPENLVALTIKEHFVAHRVFDRAHGAETTFGRGSMTGRKWVKSRMAAYMNQSKDIQDARKFLETNGDRILAADVMLKFLKWDELKREVELFRALGEVDLDMAGRFKAYFRLMAMEHHCGMAGFAERNGGQHLNIYQLFGNYS